MPAISACARCVVIFDHRFLKAAPFARCVFPVYNRLGKSGNRGAPTRTTRSSLSSSVTPRASLPSCPPARGSATLTPSEGVVCGVLCVFVVLVLQTAVGGCSAPALD